MLARKQAALVCAGHTLKVQGEGKGSGTPSGEAVLWSAGKSMSLFAMLIGPSRSLGKAVACLCN